MSGPATRWTRDACHLARDSGTAAGRASPRRAFTMIETLVVVAILALATAAGFVHLSAATRRARVESALHTLALGDAAARTAAQSGRASLLLLDADGRSLSVRHHDQRDPAWTRTLPGAVSATLRSAMGEPLSRLEFDVAGRCLDYERRVVAAGAADDAVSARIRVSGMTGWAEAIAEGAP